MLRELIIENVPIEIGNFENLKYNNRVKYFVRYGHDWFAQFVSCVYLHKANRSGRIDIKGYRGCQSVFNNFKQSNQITIYPQKGNIVLYNLKDDDRADKTGISNSSVKQQRVFKDVKAQNVSQTDFVFKASTISKFIFDTSSELATAIVILEKEGKQLHYLNGDYESNTDKNAKVTLPLIKCRNYLVNIPMMFAPDGKTVNLNIKQV